MTDKLDQYRTGIRSMLVEMFSYTEEEAEHVGIAFDIGVEGGGCGWVYDPSRGRVIPFNFNGYGYEFHSSIPMKPLGTVAAD